MTQLDAYGYGGFIFLKKENNEPLKEALALWQGQKACQHSDHADSQEHIQFWHADEIDTLHTYKGRVRFIRAATPKPDKKPARWCFALPAQPPRQFSSLP